MKIALLLALLVTSGCTAITAPIRDRMTTPGTINDSGQIEPCHNYRTDPTRCGESLFYSGQIHKVQVGQSREQVREIMRFDAQRRELSSNTETWMYVTDYDNDLMTAITFTDGKVTGLRTVPWRE